MEILMRNKDCYIVGVFLGAALSAVMPNIAVLAAVLMIVAVADLVWRAFEIMAGD